MNNFPIIFPRSVVVTCISNSDWLVKFPVVMLSVVVNTKQMSFEMSKGLVRSRMDIEYVSCDDPIHSQKWMMYTIFCWHKKLKNAHDMGCIFSTNKSNSSSCRESRDIQRWNACYKNTNSIKNIDKLYIFFISFLGRDGALFVISGILV